MKQHYPAAKLRAGAARLAGLHVVLPSGVAPHPLADHLATTVGAEPSPLPTKTAHLVKPPKPAKVVKPAKATKRATTAKGARTKQTTKAATVGHEGGGVAVTAFAAFDALQPGSYQRLGGF